MNVRQDAALTEEPMPDTLECELPVLVDEWTEAADDGSSRRQLRQLSKIARIVAWRLNVTTGSLQHSEGIENILTEVRDFHSSIKSVSRLFFRESWKRLRGSSRLAVNEQIPFELELQMKGRKGDCIWVRVFGEAHRDEHSQLWLEGAIQDISERHKARLVAAEERRIFRNLIEFALGGYWDWRVQEDRAVFSDGYLNMLGYNPGELPGTSATWRFLVPEEDVERGLAAFQEHLDSGGVSSCRFEARYRHKNGSIVWVLCVGSVIEWDSQGRPLRMVGCHIDVTKRKETERALARSEERMRMALAGANEGWCDWDLETGEIFFSPRLWSMLGYQPEEITLDQKSIFSLIHPRHRAEASFAEMLGGANDIVDGEFLLCHRDGSFIPVRVRARLYRVSEGKAKRFAGTVTDITEKKRIEAAQILAERNLQAATIAERRELAIEMHDGVSQLLTAISMKARLLHDCAGSDSKIHDHVSQLQKLVSQAQSRIRSISHGLTWLEVNRSNLIPAVRHLLESCAEGFSLSTSYSGAEQIHFRSDSDALHVFLIIQEAILNARRHSGANRLVVSVYPFSGCCAYRVDDNGKGFPLEPERVRHFGLGVSGMHHRASQCGGLLDIQSTPGTGTAVTLILPLEVCWEEKPAG